MGSYDVPWAEDDERAFQMLCESNELQTLPDIPSPPTTTPMTQHLRSQALPSLPPVKNPPVQHLQSTVYTVPTASPLRRSSNLKTDLFKMICEKVEKWVQKIWAEQEYREGTEVSWLWLSLVEKEMSAIVQSTAAYPELKKKLESRPGHLEQMVTYFVLAVAAKLYSIHNGMSDHRVIYRDFHYPPNQLLDDFGKFRSLRTDNENLTASEILESLYQTRRQQGQLCALRAESAFFDLVSRGIQVQTKEWQIVQEDLIRQEEEQKRKAQAEQEERRRAEEEKIRQVQMKQKLEQDCNVAIDKAFVGTVEKLLEEDLLRSDHRLLQQILSRAKDRDGKCGRDSHMRERTGTIVQRFETACDLALRP